MSIKERVSPEQWKSLLNAPSAASSFVASASGGGLEMIKEVLAAAKFIQEMATKTSGSGYGELVDDLLATIKGMSMDDIKGDTLKFEAEDPAAIREEVKKVVVDAAAVAASLPGGDGYKRWLLDMTRQVAETRTGGFLGIGGTSVIDEKEQAALDELATILGL